jgi:tRNA(fMet)-specific endonuclease VapC
MGILIDTGVFIRWERENGKTDFGRWANYGSPEISVITSIRIDGWRASSKHAAAQRKETALCSDYHYECLSPRGRLPIADVHSQIVATLSESGSTIGPHDNWIAATAITYDYDLLTTNANEFRRVPNLRVIDYLDTSLPDL